MFGILNNQVTQIWSKGRSTTRVAVLVAISGLAAACVSRAPTVDVAPGSQQNPQNQWNDFGSNTDPQFNQSDSGSIAATLYEASLKNDFNIDTANLSYRFSYLDKSDTGSVRFVNGTARIGLSGLKPNQEGTVTLEIYEGQTLRLKGERANVTLQPGQNNLSMSLQLIQPPQNPNGNSVPPQISPPLNQDTSLSIQISIQGFTPAPQQPQNNLQPDSNNDTTPPQQSPQSWDGISDIGNDDWSIDSID